MLTQEQRNRLHTLVQLYVEELPLQAAVDALLLIYDVCEILDLTADQLETIFGSAPLRRQRERFAAVQLQQHYGIFAFGRPIVASKVKPRDDVASRRIEVKIRPGVLVRRID